MTVKPLIRTDKRGNGVFTPEGVKLYATFGPGSKRRCYDFIERQKRA